MKKLSVVIAMLSVLVLGACGSDDDPTVDAGGSVQSHNNADVTFAQGMIPHHEQAIEMSDMVLERGANPEVKALASRIKDAQTPETALMKGWLKDWDEDLSANAGGHSGMGSGSDDSSMMSDGDMFKLGKATGAELDQMFLEMMVRHHDGAIAMAQTELSKGKFAAAKELARNIVTAQQTEITEMKRLVKASG